MSFEEAIVGAARSQQALVGALDAAYERIERQKRVLADLRALADEWHREDVEDAPCGDRTAELRERLDRLTEKQESETK